MNGVHLCLSAAPQTSGRGCILRMVGGAESVLLAVARCLVEAVAIEQPRTATRCPHRAMGRTIVAFPTDAGHGTEHRVKRYVAPLAGNKAQRRKNIDVSNK